jgi:hypothetical protein
MEGHTKWLRISYWVGAVADGVAAMAMFAQAVFARPSPLSDYVPEIPYRYAIALAGSLMLGWTALLIWADRRPYERRGVLVITIMVIFGLASSGIFAVAFGFIALKRLTPILLFQTVLVLLFAASYLSSRKPAASLVNRDT